MASSTSSPLQATRHFDGDREDDVQRKKRRLVLFYSDRIKPGDPWARSLEVYGYQSLISANPEALSGGPLSFDPEAIVIDLSQQRDVDASLDTVRRLTDEGRLAIPVIFIGDRENFGLRVQSARAGCARFLNSPVTPLTLVEHLDRLTVQNDAPFRVLTVDDSRSQSSHVRKILRDAGMVTATITDPAKSLGPLHTFRPEIIVMDLNMPGVSGDEIVSILRQEEEYATIPVVYLSEVKDPVRQDKAMMSGGDDFITKPFVPERFINSVSHRVARFRQLRELIERDSLTGLTNHSHTLKTLEYQFSEARKTDHPGSYATFDIDYFKQVNDTWGHEAGDQVIKSFARCLREMTRRYDVAGRIGGEEFALIMPKTPVEGALTVVDWLRDGFSEIEHVAGIETFKCTVSAGVAAFDAYDSELDMRHAADAALYLSKAQGRNRLTLASPEMIGLMPAFASKAR